MARRALGRLKNLGNHAIPNTKKTTLERITKGVSAILKGKENKVPVRDCFK